MKSKILISIICLTLLIPIVPTNAASLNQRLKGRILIQVESKGEAWYLNPDDLKPYYMGNKDDAYSLMRKFGAGITNKDFDKMKIKFPIKYSGKIFLKTQDNGKAYYISPVDLKPYYLGTADDAYNLMRKLGLGINNSDFYSLSNQNGTINNKKLTNQEIISKLKPATVYIETNDAAGSGMIIDNFNILTNAHVVSGATSIVIYLSNGKSLTAEIKGIDENLDLALISVKEPLNNFVTLGNSDTVTQGEEVFSLGFPFGIKGDVSFKEGTISRKLSNDTGNYFETSAEIHPGNSGGPLVDVYGNVIGINSAGFGEEVNGVMVGETIKLAIPINVAKGILTDLRNGRTYLIKPDIPAPEQTANVADPSTEFQMKAQCATLGQQKQKQEDDDWNTKHIEDGGIVYYGYSQSLNTCVYGRSYSDYILFNSMTPDLHSFFIYDLMTGDILYRDSAFAAEIAKDSNLLQQKKDSFLTKYNSLIN